MSVILYSSEGITLSQVFFGSLLIWRYVALIRLYLCSHTSLSLFTVIFFLFFFFLLLSLLSWWIYLCATNGIGSPNTQQVLPCVIGAVGKKFQQHIYHCSAAAAAEFSAGIWQKNNNLFSATVIYSKMFFNQEPASQTLGISFQGMLSSLMKW